ncbi:MAG: hypothetical protein Q9O62_15310 [Ardenticatenia bacterium]|nr:hypothetical protein [Ardenticatenia bacterium]
MMRRIGPFVLFLVLVALVGAPMVEQPALAHSGAPILVVAEQKVGPYIVSVWADPDVGGGRLSVEATLEEGAPVPAGTTVSARVWPDDGHLAEVTYTGTRTSSLLGPERFTIQVPFDAEGLWWVRLTLSGPAGTGETTFSVTATPPGTSLSLGSLLCLVPFLAVAALWWWGARRSTATSERK